MSPTVAAGKPATTFVYQRPKLYPKQEAALFDENRYSVIESSTKAGKTVAGIAWLFEQAYGGIEGQTFWWIAPVYKQAEIAFLRMQRAIPKEVVARVNQGDLVIWLVNGTVIQFKSGEKPDNLYGEDVFAAVVDEASRLREEAWHAIRSTLTATRGPIRLIGNVKGRRNFFYALARKAEGGAPNMAYHKIVASDAVAAGVLDSSEIEDAKAMLPEQVFRELYLAEPSDDGGNPFGIKAIGECVAPLSHEAPVVWGWDLAKSVDWTVGIAFDQWNRVCRFERWQRVPWMETIERIKRMTGRAPALVDSTGLGDPVLEALQKGNSNFEGYSFNAMSKQKLMEGLAVAIQSGSIKFPDGIIRQELEDFEYEATRTGVRYSAPPGFHDDCVCSLALTLSHSTHARRPMVISDAVMNWSSQRG